MRDDMGVDMIVHACYRGFGSSTCGIGKRAGNGHSPLRSSCCFYSFFQALQIAQSRITTGLMRSRGLFFISSRASSMCSKPWKRCVMSGRVSRRPVCSSAASFSMRRRPPGIRPPAMVLWPMPQPHSARGMRTFSPLPR